MGGLYATADIHAPRYYALFREALARLSREAGEVCALILAGDIVDSGKASMLEPVLRAIDSELGAVKVVAVFGNEEYEEVRDTLKRISAGRVEWLDDSVTYVECNGERVGIVGTSGALDRPTRWQRRHKPHLARLYAERPRIVEGLLSEAKRNADRVVLVSHYGLSRATLRGEDPRFWPEMYSSALEDVVRRLRPDAAVHGHAHNGTPYALVGGVPVYNVALPLNRRIVEVKWRRGLEAFL
ncbi:MAG: metallophosphoesterase [Desulfurococcales archaeon]|nr:metallophosphoesterase [Desulfurococcales archaeon]